MTGQPRAVISDMPRYRPGRSAAQAEAEHGISDAVKLASNEMPWPPPPEVVSAMADAVATANTYPDHRSASVRSALASYYDRPEEQFTVGAGSAALLLQLALAYVEPGDEVLYPWRSFETYPIFTRLAGGRAVTTLLADYRFDLAATAAAVTDATKLIYLSNPNNPTGTAVGLDEVEDLLGQVPSSVIVCLDEAYREFVDPDLADPLDGLVDQHSNLVVMRTFSKAFGLAGQRVGYAVAHPDVIATIDKTSAPFPVTAASAAGAVASLSADAYWAPKRELIRSERQRVTEALVTAGVDVPRSHANFVYLPLGDDTEAVFVGLERQGVVTRPFEGEGLRVTIGTPEQNDRFLAALSACGVVMTGHRT